MSDLLRRSFRHEALVVGLVLAVVAAVYVWAAHYRLDLLDEGYFAYTSSRVLAGDLPYRDFSTPYTPAFFYVNAWLFRLFGLDLLTLRLSLIAVRVGILALVYLLGRRIMPPAFAAIPVGMLLIQDQIPGAWESHPAWWATFWFLLATWCVCRHREDGGVGWWLIASLAAGLAYAFKQNVGLFALVALMTVAASEIAVLPKLTTPTWMGQLVRLVPTPLARASVWTAGPLALQTLSLIVTLAMRAHLSLGLFAVLAVPFWGLATERLRAARQNLASVEPCDVEQRLADLSSRIGLTAICFALVTLPWLAVLFAALGAETPLAQFVGGVDSTGYYLELDWLRPEALPVLALVVLTPGIVWALLRPLPLWLRLMIGLAGAALAVALLTELMRPAPAVHDRTLRAGVLLAVQATTNLLLYLPSVAFWCGLALLVAGRVAPPLRFYLRWCLLAGSLLLLNQYPRFDDVHLLFSAHLLWIVGAYVTWRLFRRMTRDLPARAVGAIGRAATYAALLLLPLASLWPIVEARRADLLVRRPGGLLVLATPTYRQLALRGTNVLEIDVLGWKYPLIASYIQERTLPEDRIFVYPANPLLYFVLDRPNATRFNHVLPGLLSASDEQETIARLDSVPAKYVIWDVFGADYWGKTGFNQRLTDYIWERYEPVEEIGGFAILRRR